MKIDTIGKEAATADCDNRTCHLVRFCERRIMKYDTADSVQSRIRLFWASVILYNCMDVLADLEYIHQHSMKNYISVFSESLGKRH